ncbi:MAG: ParB/RepB/Spo0J family partition protein [Candidatus Kaiserbacteria bacterium]|nr:ParB/RepB/Spo0J family partition protein [Candidatus Kaiserbacteria bacterium]
MASPYQGDSIFWVEVDRIEPNPFQPRRTFDEAALASLSESIRQYGVLQPLTVTRKEIERPGEGIYVQYELVAGERRLRASKLAGLREVPVVIRSSEDSDRMKLELAIIENLQREDLNALDRAKAFKRLVDEFSMQHKDIALKVGKSREYVSNTLRILMLPEVMQNALQSGEITEGHTRPLLMLADKPEEQMTIFKEILTRKITVRDTEQMARRIAVERVRHKALLSPDLLDLEKQLSERLGTRVRIERKESGGKLMIEFFSPEDLTQLCRTLAQESTAPEPGPVPPEEPPQPEPAKKEPENDLYSISNFSV